jgi:hypothetical protein
MPHALTVHASTYSLLRNLTTPDQVQEPLRQK